LDEQLMELFEAAEMSMHQEVWTHTIWHCMIPRIMCSISLNQDNGHNSGCRWADTVLDSSRQLPAKNMMKLMQGHVP